MPTRRPAAILVALVALLAVAALPALAAEGAKEGGSEAVLVAQIIALVLAGRLLGEAMQRIGQPAVMGQLLAGLLLGPSLFGALWPEAQHALFPAKGEQKAMLDAVSHLGILMLLLLAGMETDLSLVRKVKRAALSTSVAGIAIPFACGFALGEFLPQGMLPRPDQRLVTSLFLGTALSISSLKIVAVVVREMGFLRRNVGQVILATAVTDDTIGWIIIAITFGLASHGGLELGPLAFTVGATLLFLGVSVTLGRRFVFFVIRSANDHFVSEAPVISTILVVMGAMALLTNAIGVHTVLGAFVAGVLVGQSPILTRQIDERLRGLITALFMPVFFGVAGLGANLTVLRDPHLLLLTLGLVLIASVGKFGGAFLGGRIGGMNAAEALALGCGMNARGSTEVIVASIGLSMGVLSRDLYTMIVTMAVVTTMAMPPSLRWALGRLPLGEEERTRLEREAFEAKGFVPNLERLLLAADDSPKGRFAARLAGLLAGLRGMPVTVLDLANAARPDAPPEVEGVVRATAEAVQAAGHREADEPAPDPVPVLTRETEASAPEAVAEEARKGYDLLVLGVGPTVGPEGGFSTEVARVTGAFEGPLALAAARGAHESEPLNGQLSILAPVTGAEVSRRGAEVAFALAKAADAPVTVLSVARKVTGSGLRYRLLGEARRSRETLLKEIVGMADQYGVEVRTATRADLPPADAILRQARLGGHNLIVMGVSRRAGETLFFGDVAAAVLDSSDRSLLYVAS